ncbi:MAG: hypothetical protein IJK97_13530 [Thermoguttaceae bacterium]|nr:hypothetical protein [Thermoguttaceae bacterium]
MNHRFKKIGIIFFLKPKNWLAEKLRGSANVPYFHRVNQQYEPVSTVAVGIIHHPGCVSGQLLERIRIQLRAQFFELFHAGKGIFFQF